MRIVPSLLMAILAGGFFWLFLIRYWFYRDCIEAAASSCITPDGVNLIEGGAFWIVPAIGSAVVALVKWPWHGR
ncbi:MAG: hypothetical protein ABI414_06690 [Devosia sp.]